MPVDVIVSTDSVAVAAAKDATSTVPIVLQGTGNPVPAKLVASVDHPGANITGIIEAVPGIYDKRLQLLKDAFPNVVHVATIVQAGHPTTPGLLNALQAAARGTQLQLQVHQVGTAPDIESAFSTEGEQVDALFVGRQAFLATNKDRLVQLAARTGLPAMYSTREFVEAGGLMGYGASEEEIARRTAGVVDRILKGANPAETPIEQAATFEFVVNLTTAHTLGLSIPQAVLDQATAVIQ